MRDRADVVVIGAGIMGLSIAYHLAELGITDVTVVDRGYLCGGASGRNGGGVRAQWSSEDNVRLMLESIRMCRDFAAKMKVNVWFRQGGYLFVARSTQVRERLEASVALQNACGLATRMLAPREAARVVPQLDTDGIEAASYNPDDGVAFPWPFVWGYARAARALGVEIAPWHEVVGFETRGATIEGVRVRRSGPPGSAESASGATTTIRTNKVVNAAGAWSPAVAKNLGIDLPNRPHRHEICSTEPLKPWLKPLVADLSDGLYFSQSTRGEIVGGIGNEYVPAGLTQDSSHAFLGRYASSLVRTCPALGSVKVLRQWAGCYDLTPDANPIVGPVDGVEDFHQASGFMGHGFMMAPVVGRLLAGVVAERPKDPTFGPVLERWALRRFKEGKLLSEKMIIG
jgi:sarcosine oxidase subunit beta